MIRIHDELFVNPANVTHLTREPAGVRIHFTSERFEYVPAAMVPGLEGHNQSMIVGDAMRALAKAIGMGVSL
jgi:hypothetical protein